MLRNKPLQDHKTTIIDPSNIKIHALRNGTAEDTTSSYSPAESLAHAKPSGHESHSEQSAGDKRRHYSNPLIMQIHCAVIAEYIDEPFTVQDIEQWMAQFDIRKDDGKRYKKGYAANLLSNSLIKKKKTKNRNSKWLNRRINENGVFEYWFAD